MTKKEKSLAVKFLDVQAQNQALKKQLLQAISQTIESSQFILGPHVSSLEQAIASECKTKFAVGVNSGTDALVIALKALDIGPGDEVLVPDFTFIASATSVMLVGATPVLVDVDPKTFMIDLEAAQKKVTKKTKAVIPVHLYGQAANMTAIMKFAKQANLKVIEDAAQALGATWKGKPVGSFGDAGCLSFFPTKNLGALGDAGMIVTNNSKLEKRLKRLRQHGADRKYFHDELGFNSRLDAIQAAALMTKLPYYELWNKRRQSIAQAYDKELGGLVQTPLVQPGATHVYHQYAILTDDRNQLQKYLSERQIGTGVHYPLPLHQQPAFQHLASAKKSYPVSEAICRQVLCLPIVPEVPDEGVRQVIEGIKEFFNQ